MNQICQEIINSMLLFPDNKSPELYGAIAAAGAVQVRSGCEMSGEITTIDTFNGYDMCSDDYSTIIFDLIAHIKNNPDLTRDDILELLTHVNYAAWNYCPYQPYKAVES